MVEPSLCEPQFQPTQLVVCGKGPLLRVTCIGQWQIWQEAVSEGRGTVTSEALGCLQVEVFLVREMVISSVHQAEGCETR